jgi:GTPase SAR1 family protein
MRPYHPETNPFSTRYVKPGALPFVFPEGTTISTLADRFLAAHLRGAIVGPHGSGKSTLLMALVSELKTRNIDTTLISLHDGERHLPPHTAAPENGVLAIDGYEQLSCFTRWRINARAARQRSGLLVTSHRPIGIAVLFETKPSVEIAAALVNRLTRNNARTFTWDDIAESFAKSSGNIRETLFDLYDRYDQKKSIEPVAV